mgnify:CR=1 FL=1
MQIRRLTAVFAVNFRFGLSSPNFRFLCVSGSPAIILGFVFPKEFQCQSFRRLERGMKNGSSSQALIMAKVFAPVMERDAEVWEHSATWRISRRDSISDNQRHAQYVESASLSFAFSISLSINFALSVSPSSGNGSIGGGLHGISATGIVGFSIGGASSKPISSDEGSMLS